MFINGLDVNPATGRGRVNFNVLAGVGTSRAGLTYDATSALACDSDVIAPTDLFVAGGGFVSNGGIRAPSVKTIDALPNPAVSTGGLLYSQGGQLAITAANPVAGWVKGWPVDATGRLCVEAV